MSLTRKLGTAALVVAGALTIGGCGFSQDYIKPDIKIKNKGKVFKSYDENKDSRADKIVITGTLKEFAKDWILTIEDTDFNNSWDRITLKSETQHSFPPKYELNILFDKDNDGIYERAILEFEQNFLQRKYEFIDSNKDGQFDNCICTKAETFLDEERAQNPRFLRDFNLRAGVMNLMSQTYRMILKYQK